ncbi:MAG: 5-(carboxyamino)imidazole ribonucleotide synthase [Bacteroidales bacterium]|jgi:5-(carboxyamino)imidazole ribonucleotide synthase|nr:5-(carboxyamino)imidazole ribonucleotide synthase [Bacteroidales bacterium]MDY0086284.1 5-(carboxyamino)imidazole ribonucleotide synthase [Bacteroidales bacterium]
MIDLSNISSLRLGITAGGQLAKMLVLAASNWDIKTYVMDADPDCPAAHNCTKFFKGSHTNYDDVYRFGQEVDMITYEIESINVEALKKLKSEGKIILPDPEILETIQDKGLQKLFFENHQIPTADFKLYKNKSEIMKAIQQAELSVPFVQKVRQGGYDGRGVIVVSDASDFAKLIDSPSVIEKKIKIKKEIAIIAARSSSGEVSHFPAVEMEFNPEANLVEKLICPADISQNISTKAGKLADDLISAWDMTGLLAIEMFVDENDEIWINEVAPRPHNSGHHTIESIVTSQFEQLLRAILGLPLGSMELKKPAIMLNLLGEPGYEGIAKYHGLHQALQIAGVKVHLYGKKITKPFRKMGHITILGNDRQDVIDKANQVKNLIKIVS